MILFQRKKKYFSAKKIMLKCKAKWVKIALLNLI